MAKVTFTVEGREPLDLNGKDVAPGRVILEGTIPEGITTGDLVVAIRSGRIRVAEVGEVDQRPKRQTAKVNA